MIGFYLLSEDVNIFPLTGSAMGGGLLSISGPCFDNFTAIECQFGDGITSNAVFANAIRAYCPIPMQNMFGSMQLTLLGRKESGEVISYPERLFSASEL